MTDIIEAIDAWTLSRYNPLYTIKLFGFSELFKRSAGEGSVEQNFPATIPDRTKVSIDDRYNFITWMRWAQPVTYEQSEEWSFGPEDARVGIIPIRLVLAHKTSLGENVVFDFINAFPSKFTISGYQFVFTNANINADPDHESVVQQELGPQNYAFYEKHRIKWNVYVLTINVQFMLCREEFAEDGLVTEDDEDIIVTE